jgi:hypothetical protein
VGHDQQGKTSGAGAWEDSQRRVKERNEETRRLAKKERAETERRVQAAQRMRDQRAGVYR